MTKKEDEYKKGLWTEEEDKILLEYIRVHGKRQWNRIPKATGLKRSGKSCRLRWLNYLSPNVNHGNFTEEEEDLIIRLHKLLGNRWSLIAGRVPGRTDNQVKNYWNTHLRKKLGMQKQTKSVIISSGSKSSRVEGTQNLAMILNSEPLASEYKHKGIEELGQRSCLNNNEACSKVQWPEAEMQFDYSFLQADDNYFVNCPNLMEFIDDFEL